MLYRRNIKEMNKKLMMIIIIKTNEVLVKSSHSLLLQEHSTVVRIMKISNIMLV